jgi:hypothetical protein
MALTNDDYWKGGYDDGLSDAENIVAKFADEGADEVIFRLRELRGWLPCNTCKGTGKNLAPTHRDLLFSLMASAGATVHPSPLKCKACCGERMVPPQEAAA